MKTWLSKGLLAAVIALPAMSGTAWAHDDGGCSEATLRGDYAFSVVDLTTQGVVIGLATFDGKGGFAQIDYPGDRLRTAGTLDFRMGQTGSYTVDRNCTGTMEINLGGGVGVVTNAFVISNGSIHAVVAGVTVGGKAVPNQTRVDFWEVASEQDN
jgi:hypothetical protein